MDEKQLQKLEALYEAATPGRRKVVNLNEGDPIEYGPFWAVTNDVLDDEDGWAVEVRTGGKEDADFDAEIYNAFPKLLAEIRRLRMALEAIADEPELTSDLAIGMAKHALNGGAK